MVLRGIQGGFRAFSMGLKKVHVRFLEGRIQRDLSLVSKRFQMVLSGFHEILRRCHGSSIGFQRVLLDFSDTREFKSV